LLPCKRQPRVERKRNVSKPDPLKGLEFRKVVAICTSAVMIIALIGFTVFTVTESNNARTIEERKLEESARKSKATDDLEAARVRAAKEVREAEIKSKKRKIWERDAKGDTGGPESSAYGPGKEGF
jgi:hypothetical protein